jgi:hypothetical protein
MEWEHRIRGGMEWEHMIRDSMEWEHMIRDSMEWEHMIRDSMEWEHMIRGGGMEWENRIRGDLPPCHTTPTATPPLRPGLVGRRFGLGIMHPSYYMSVLRLPLQSHCNNCTSCHHTVALFLFGIWKR